jgi:phosphoribosylanthranilate isomerase
VMVKVCGITRREDAEAAVAAGASAIGFVFYPKSPRYLTAETAAELGRGLDVWKVGVFVDESPASVEAVMRAAHLDVAQIYGGDLPHVPRIWRALRLVGQTSRSAWDLKIPLKVEAILLDGPANGITFDWKQAQGVSEKLGVPEKLILAGGLNASNVSEAIRVAKPWGVDASSGLESSPGIKDHDKVRQFIKAAQQAS